MDKVKVILAGLKKYHFWVICAAVILVGLVMWTMATADLDDSTKACTGKIQKTKSDVAGLIGKPLVNNGVIEVEQKETDKVHEEAQKAWEILYNYQKEKNDWPAELGADFHDMITTVEKQGPDAEIPREYRELYQNFIDQHFPKVYEIIDLRLDAQLDANGKVKLDSQGQPLKVDPLSKEAADDHGVPVPGKHGETSRRIVPPKIGKVYWNQADLHRVKGQIKEGATQIGQRRAPMGVDAQYPASPSGPGRSLGLPGAFADDRRHQQHADLFSQDAHQADRCPGHRPGGRRLVREGRRTNPHGAAKRRRSRPRSDRRGGFCPRT